MDFSAIKSLIRQNIKTNNEEYITGAVMQSVLLGMIDTLGEQGINTIIPAVDEKLDEALEGITDGLVTEEPNLNMYKKTGLFLLHDAITYTNMPQGVTIGFLRVSTFNDADFVVQEIYDFFGHKLFERKYGNSTWDEWGKISKTNGEIGGEQNLNQYTKDGLFLLVDNITYTNKPNGISCGFLRVTVFDDTKVLQELYDFESHTLYQRQYSPSSWTSWGAIGEVQAVLEDADLNNITYNGFYILSDDRTYQNMPVLPDGNTMTYGWLKNHVIEYDSWCMQECMTLDGQFTFRRYGHVGGRFSDWVTFRHNRGGILPDNTDLNKFYEEGTYLLIDSYSYDNAPDGWWVGWMRVTNENGSWILQEFYGWDSSLYKRQFNVTDESRPDWVRISGGGNTYNNTYNFNEYSQAVTLNASPTITTDTNNYLASTGDTTDRTADILAMLQATGICNLGPGIFYVGNLIMPDGTTIKGSGQNTEVRLLASVTNGHAIRMGSRCSLESFVLNGLDSMGSTVGNRHGILWQGNYTQSQTAPIASLLHDLVIQNFSGGGITCYDTGYGTYNFLNVTNVNISNCGAGINISYWSEFNKFTNVCCNNCYIGCVNNGGNNMFVNCDFSSSRYVAFLMDNSQGQSPNNSHGSCIGCVFNHTASNTGDGIKVLNCDVGFVFDGCQIFYSKIHIEDSDGVEFTACNFGYENCDISISGGGLALFANNMHQGVPTITITDNTKTHFVNCYVRSTGEVVNV